MSKELIVSANRHETRVAVLEEDQVVEIFYQRENEYSLAGSIHKGRVTRVLPGMQSAFVDIGLERDAFLYVSDFMELEEHDEDVTDIVPAGRGVQDMRPQPAQGVEGADLAELAGTPEGASRQEFGGAEEPTDGQPSITAAGSADPSATAARDSQERERGGGRGARPVGGGGGALAGGGAGSGLSRRGGQRRWLRVRRSLPPHLLVRWKRGEASSSDRPPD